MGGTKAPCLLDHLDHLLAQDSGSLSQASALSPITWQWNDRVFEFVQMQSAKTYSLIFIGKQNEYVNELKMPT